MQKYYLLIWSERVCTYVAITYVHAKSAASTTTVGQSYNYNYYTWKHSLADNSETINREKDFGYNVTEYLLDGSLPGTWSVNVNYLGNKSLTPTYLKATVYYNYGSRSQQKETKVFKLDLKNVNQELFKLQESARIIAE